MVIELYDPDDVDPELYGLLHSVSLEAEPTPSLTYHTSRRTSNQGISGLTSPVRPPLNLETPPTSNRSNQPQKSGPNSSHRRIDLSKLTSSVDNKSPGQLESISVSLNTSMQSLGQAGGDVT